MNKFARSSVHWIALTAALLITAALYWSGLHGGFLFDDFPNIVDNSGVQPQTADVASLIRAALSSPASDFKRPLASLSFAVNYLATGLDPYWMKLTNLIIHLLNGLLVFFLTRSLLGYEKSASSKRQREIVAILIAFGWLLLPINLTAVLYVVQRMESLANLFVLTGMIGYLAGRKRMLDSPAAAAPVARRSNWAALLLCVISLTIPTAVGCLAKETAVMLPLYAFLIEWVLFGFTRFPSNTPNFRTRFGNIDWRIVALFFVVLVIPFILGIGWLLPGVLKPDTWIARGFTLNERLLSEARIVVSYIAWTLLPIPNELSFYHDNFEVSTGLLTPLTTLASVLAIIGLISVAIWLRRQRPLIALGILLFFGCQLMTATILPLELIYEHRNYFASFGLMMAVIPLLTPVTLNANALHQDFFLARSTLLVCLLLLWAGETAMTAASWRSPLELAATLAARAPDSPRAQYELGRTYIIYSHYDPASPFTKMAYAPLERAATLQGSSILPEQALIFMNARMQLPLKQAWWDSLIEKLRIHKPGVQDESSLGALTQCARDHECDLPKSSMVEAFEAALSHPNPSARLLAMYGDYAWNVLDNHKLGERMTYGAVQTQPREPAYHVTLIRMYIAEGEMEKASDGIEALKKLNIGGSLDEDIGKLQRAMK